MKNLIKLNRVFEKYAGVLSLRAKAGKPYSVLVSDADRQSLPESFAAYAQAREKLDELTKAGINAAIVKTDPHAKDIKLGYTLYVRPVTGSFDRY